jgi:hypothetical protein
VVKKKIAWLKTRIAELNRTKPAGWRDRSRRYEDAVAGLTELIAAKPARK